MYAKHGHRHIRGRQDNVSTRLAWKLSTYAQLRAWYGKANTTSEHESMGGTHVGGYEVRFLVATKPLTVMVVFPQKQAS